ncbi:hypothetical protein BV898_05038 [Hypsibius exemplaris]|uniref:TRPM-like domain-containing protein n=1 Tax=Hypsibius exemplaris TaxID=2072580 RepID=A0A1W0X0I0_HYPEX|nr:hypothetical protein BV898_05038 [Hypsibius exemplaris]
MNWDQFVRNFLLCVKCNRMEVVSQCLWDCPPWNTVYNEWEVNQFTYPGLVASLILPGREAFVDMLLYQKFPVRFLTSHLDLLHFFQKAGDRQTFLSLVWQDILGHSQTDAIGEGFILTELNPLIHQLTDVRNFLDLYELSRIALTRNDGTADPIESDSNSLSALIVYAVLLNRPKLVMVLIKHSSDPIPHIVFAETMYRNLSKASRNVELHMALKRQAENMGKIAADILDVGIRESPLRTQTFFQRVIPAFNSKTLLRMAFDARNRRFISHPLVQDWLDHFASSFIRIKGTNRELKLVLSAYLIFPMYLWLTFPRHLRRDRHFAQTKDVTYIHEPKSGVTPVLSFPSFPGMIYAVWSAPLVKFWTWFISYVMFLILIGVDMMTPACTNFSLDIAVFIWATLILVDLTLRTIQHYLWRKRRQPVIRNVYHIFSQFIFLSLFFPYRIAPYRYEHPFAGRVILAFGVLYYYYAVWGIFFTFFRPLGPLVKIFSMMFKLDLPRWIAVITPFLIASSVVWQAVITPDYPMGGEVWRRAITRQISVLFGGLSNELEFNAACERTSRINWSNFSHPPDRCWVGAYSDYTCNTVSAWSYIFMASYYVFLKFGMMIMLVVIYTARFSSEMNKATLMWKYERFQTLFEHYWRTSLPFPLSICGSVYLIYLHYVYGKQLTEPATDPELGNLKMDTFIYWKSVAIEYFAQIDREESNRSVGRQNSSLLGTMKKDMRAAMGKVDELDRKVAHSNGKLRDLQERYRPIARRLAVVSALNPVRHVRSRLGTYPDTTLQRTTVADHQLSWTTPMPNYNPPTYTTVTKEGTSDSQGVHDTWISDEDGEWIRYEFDSTGLPRNPSGRTGLGGRGIYLQYGPNRRIVLAITTANRDGRLAFIATDGERNQANLPVVSEIRSESGYPEAGRLLLDVFCCASHRVKVNYDPLKLQTKADLRQLMQLVLGSQPPCRYPKEEISFQVDIRAIYRGYLDSSLNTDNAWAEVLVLHVSVPDIQLPAPSVYYWLDLASRGTLSHHIDSDILEYLAV